MELFEESSVSGDTLEETKIEKFYFGCGEDSVVLRISSEEAPNKEGSLNAGNSAKVPETTSAPLSSTLSLGKRSHSRFEVANSIIVLSKSRLLGKKQQLSRNTSLVNLSIKGLQIITAAQLDPGEKYNINLFAPGLSCSMDIKAKVVWCKQSEKKAAEPYYRIGFKFMDMKEEVENTLNELESYCLKNS
jgi:hypothetical protein